MYNLEFRKRYISLRLGRYKDETQVFFRSFGSYLLLLLSDCIALRFALCGRHKSISRDTLRSFTLDFVSCRDTLPSFTVDFVSLSYWWLPDRLCETKKSEREARSCGALSSVQNCHCPLNCFQLLHNYLRVTSPKIKGAREDNEFGVY